MRNRGLKVLNHVILLIKDKILLERSAYLLLLTNIIPKLMDKNKALNKSILVT